VYIASYLGLPKWGDIRLTRNIPKTRRAAVLMGDLRGNFLERAVKLFAAVCCYELIKNQFSLSGMVYYRAGRVTPKRV
jgi:hypothetical protein